MGWGGVKFKRSAACRQASTQRTDAPGLGCVCLRTGCDGHPLDGEPWGGGPKDLLRPSRSGTGEGLAPPPTVGAQP